MAIRRLACFAGVAALVTAVAAIANAEQRGRPPRLDVPYVATAHDVVTAMLKLTAAGPEDIVYDVGSGDGRIVVAAVRDFGVREAIGVDIDIHRVRQGAANAAAAGVGDRARFVQGDVYKFDFSAATVLTMYLSPRINREIRPRILQEMRPGSRVVSHAFLMDDWEPDRSERVGNRWIHFWVVPADVRGRWRWQNGIRHYRLELSQKFQKIAGRLEAPDQTAPIEQAQLVGDRLHVEARLGESMLRFDGIVSGDTITATVVAGETTRIVAQRER